MKPEVPQILINREPLHHFNFDVELLGNCDAIIHELCRRLGDEWADIPEDYEMPLLGKETVEKLFESSSESESEESDDEMEAVDIKKPIDGQTSQFCKSTEDQKYENRPNHLNSENTSVSIDSVYINLNHISCEVPKECGSVSENNHDRSDTRDSAESRKDSVDITDNHIMASDSAQTSSQKLSIGDDSQSVIGSCSSNSVENQSHTTLRSKSSDATNVVQCQPPEPIVNPSPQIAIETQPHNAIENISHDTSGSQSKDPLLSPSGMQAQSHSSVSSEECVPGDFVRVQCQDCTNSEFHSNKMVDRKRIIDEVSKKCADCEKQKAYERSEFLSEARLGQTNHNDLCKCGNVSKRRKRDSSCSLGPKDDVKGQKVVTPLTDQHKDEVPGTLLDSAPAENKSEEDIRGNSPDFDKASVMERFDKEGKFFLFLFGM